MDNEDHYLIPKDIFIYLSKCFLTYNDKYSDNIEHFEHVCDMIKLIYMKCEEEKNTKNY